MSQEHFLISPTIDLFIYDLKEGLGQDEDKIQQNRQEFWQKIYGNTLDDQLLEELCKAERDGYEDVLLLGEKEKIKKFQHSLDGYYYPLQLGDTYALQLDCT